MGSTPRTLVSVPTYLGPLDLRGRILIFRLWVCADAGPVNRFQKSKQVVSYLGLNPSEESSGGRQRLGAISKQGNSMMRHLLGEAAQTASRFDPELRRTYQRLKFRRGSGVAKVAIARKLAVRLYWKLREASQQVPPARMQGSPKISLVDVSPSYL